MLVPEPLSMPSPKSVSSPSRRLPVVLPPKNGKASPKSAAKSPPAASTSPQDPAPASQKPGRPVLKPGEFLCDYCSAKCCKYFAWPIEAPSTREDFDFVRWAMLHTSTTYFVEDEVWYLLVHAHCKHLQSDNRCGIYHTRPQICRDYSTDDCEFDDHYVYEKYFETPEQMDEYVEVLLPPKGRTGIRSPKPPLLPIL
jgi:Fe-S-cluster containining protein